MQVYMNVEKGESMKKFSNIEIVCFFVCTITGYIVVSVYKISLQQFSIEIISIIIVFN